MTLPKCLQKWAHLIAEVSDERRTGDDGQGDGYWVYLAPGYWHSAGECHCIHEDTPSQCAAEMKSVKPCECCQSERTA